MPQFDIITFFTQIFWLTIIFFGFYFVSLDSLLPRTQHARHAKQQQETTRKMQHGQCTSHATTDPGQVRGWMRGGSCLLRVRC